MALNKICPSCRKKNEVTALQCECGYDLSTIRPHEEEEEQDFGFDSLFTNAENDTQLDNICDTNQSYHSLSLKTSNNHSDSFPFDNFSSDEKSSNLLQEDNQFINPYSNDRIKENAEDISHNLDEDNALVCSNNIDKDKKLINLGKSSIVDNVKQKNIDVPSLKDCNNNDFLRSEPEKIHQLNNNIDTSCYEIVSSDQNMELILDNPPLIIGRDSNNESLCSYLKDRLGVSRKHAVLSLEDGYLFIQDLDSKNGTFVNDVRLEPEETRRLERNDRVSLGGRASTNDKKLIAVFFIR